MYRAGLGFQALPGRWKLAEYAGASRAPEDDTSRCSAGSGNTRTYPGTAKRPVETCLKPTHAVSTKPLSSQKRRQVSLAHMNPFPPTRKTTRTALDIKAMVSLTQTRLRHREPLTPYKRFFHGDRRLDSPILPCLWHACPVGSAPESVGEVASVRATPNEQMGSGEGGEG